MHHLYNDACFLGPGRLLGGHENSSNSFVKDVLKSFLGESRAFEISDRIDLFRALDALRVSYGSHPFLAQSLNSLGIVAEIELGTNEDDGDVRRVMRNLRVPLGQDIVK